MKRIKRYFSLGVTRILKLKSAFMKRMPSIWTWFYLNFFSKLFYDVTIQRYWAQKCMFHFEKTNEISTLQSNVFKAWGHKTIWKINSNRTNSKYLEYISLRPILILKSLKIPLKNSVLFAFRWKQFFRKCIYV